MLLGYNQKRPTARNYQDFMDRLVRGLENLRQDGLSLMVYGSFVRGDYNPGRSDIDALMVFPDDVVIDKQKLGLAGKVLHYALKGNNIPFQVCVTDIATMREGRFNTYDESFKGYFAEEAKIMVGPDYRHEFIYELPSMNDQIPVRFNLRKTRTGLLYAEHDRAEDYEAFLRKFTKSLDAVSRGSKQILLFIDGTLRKNRFAAQKVMHEYFPEIDAEPLQRIKRLYHNLDEMDRLFQQPDDVVQLWNASATFFEEMIRAYIRKYPKR